VRTEREITFLREYRTRLIADVVTGKLDVREAAAQLPEEPDEPELAEEIEDQVEGEKGPEGTDLDMIPEEASIADSTQETENFFRPVAC
jgi:type I restriction enzyme, S subunit